MRAEGRGMNESRIQKPGVRIQKKTEAALSLFILDSEC